MAKEVTVGSRFAFATGATSLVFPLANAFRNGWKTNQATIDTGHVIVELARRLGLVRVEPSVPMLIIALKRRRLQQPDTEPSAVPVEDRLDLETQAILREAAWMARRRLKLPFQESAPMWGPDVTQAVRRALDDARSVGVFRATASHLLIATLTESDNNAHRLLNDVNLRPESLLKAARAGSVVGRSGKTMVDGIYGLKLFDLLQSGSSKSMRRMGRVLRLMKPRAQPILVALRTEAVRQAVRLNSHQVDQAHLLAAICAIEEELCVDCDRFADRFLPVNGAGHLLANWGVDYTALGLALAARVTRPCAVADRPGWRPRLSDPPVCVDLAAALRVAETRVRGLGHRWAGTNDVMTVVLEDEHGAAGRLLTTCGVNVSGLRDSLSGQSGGPTVPRG